MLEGIVGQRKLTLFRVHLPVDQWKDRFDPGPIARIRVNRQVLSQQSDSLSNTMQTEAIPFRLMFVESDSIVPNPDDDIFVLMDE